MDDLILKILRNENGTLNYECSDIPMTAHDIARDIITDFAKGDAEKFDTLVAIVTQTLAREDSGFLEKQFYKVCKDLVKVVRAEIMKQGKAPTQIRSNKKLS